MTSKINSVKAYIRGYVSSFVCDSNPNEIKNPYLPKSVEWYDWNRGWNSNDEDI